MNSLYLALNLGLVVFVACYGLLFIVGGAAKANPFAGFVFKHLVKGGKALARTLIELMQRLANAIFDGLKHLLR